MAITSYKAVVGYYNSAGTPNITTAVTGQLSDGWTPIGAPILTDAYGQCTQMMAKTDAVPVIATSAYTVVTAANPQPPDATWDAQGEPLWIDTATYLQAYTKGGAYLQGDINLASNRVVGVLPVSKGGTGAVTVNDARVNLGVDTFAHTTNLTTVQSPNALYRMFIRDDGYVGFQKSTSVIAQDWTPLALGFEYGGTGVTSKGEIWGAIRPEGPTPLFADPVNELDATTKQWVSDLDATTRQWVSDLDASTRQWVSDLRSVNDSWTVSKVDATTPPATTVVSGGAVVSDYKIGTTSTYRATLQSYGTIGGTASQQGARLTTGGVSYDFTANGTLMLPNASPQIGTRRPGGEIVMDGFVRPKDLLAQPLNSVGVLANERNAMRMINFVQTTPGYVGYFSGDWYEGRYIFGGVRGISTNLERAQITVADGISLQADFQFFPTGTAMAQNWQSTSDQRLKTDIKRIDEPLTKMRQIRGVTWKRLDKSYVPDGIGFIAQEVETAFPDFVNVNGSYSIELKDGTVVENIRSLDTGGVAAALHHEAILALMDKVEALEAELAALKSGK